MPKRERAATATRFAATKKGTSRGVKDANMRIGILGSGLMGGKLGTIFAKAGHDVLFSYARSPRKLNRLARQAGRPQRPARRARPPQMPTCCSWPSIGPASTTC